MNAPLEGNRLSPTVDPVTPGYRLSGRPVCE